MPLFQFSSSNKRQQQQKSYTLNRSKNSRRTKTNLLLWGFYLVAIVCVLVIGTSWTVYWHQIHPSTVNDASSSLRNTNQANDEQSTPTVKADKTAKATAVSWTVSNGRSSGQQEQPKLPKWIQDYMNWHHEMRIKFPGQEIITNPNAPPVLVRTCLGLCGGLHDRIGQLPLDLYIANQTQRILLIKWIKPHPLEEFLVPPPEGGLNWVFPSGIENWGTDCRTLNECAKQVRNHPSLKTNQSGDRTTDFKERMKENMEALLNGSLSKEKAVTFQLLGHLNEDWLEDKLRQLGESDMIHTSPTFGNIFRTFFQPNPNVQKEIDDVYTKYKLAPNQYTMVHCRVRHPKAYPNGIKFNGQYVSNADKLGLPFEGPFKDEAVNIASRAIRCAATLMNEAEKNTEKIYFMADESNLVKYMTRDLVNATYLTEHPQWFTDSQSANTTAKQVMHDYNVVSRSQDIKNAHIDKNKGRTKEEYYGTFVDLWLGIQAKCVSFGIGNFAMFATKISATKCKIKYAKELWGQEDTTHKEETPTCNLD